MKLPLAFRRRLGVAAVMGLVIGLGTPGQRASAESCFDHDLFSWDRDLDYRQALATETLLPQRVIVDGRTVSTGLSEAALERSLGTRYRVIEDWAARDAEQQCACLRSVGLSNSNSMYHYILEDRNVRRLSGSFRVCGWEIPGVGELRAFLHKPADSAVAHAYLLQLAMTPVAESTVSYARGSALRLIRSGPPRVEWDIPRNRVMIGKAIGGRNGP